MSPFTELVYPRDRLKDAILAVVIGQVGEPVRGPKNSKHRWGPPDGDVLWAVGWMVSEETWIL